MTLADGDRFRLGQQLMRFDDLEGRLRSVKATADGTHILGSPTKGLWGKLVCILDAQANVEEWTLATPEVYLGRERGTITFPDDLFMVPIAGSVVAGETI